MYRGLQKKTSVDQKPVTVTEWSAATHKDKNKNENTEGEHISLSAGDGIPHSIGLVGAVSIFFRAFCFIFAPFTVWKRPHHAVARLDTRPTQTGYYIFSSWFRWARALVTVMMGVISINYRRRRQWFLICLMALNPGRDN